MGLFSGDPGKSTESSQSTSTFTPDAGRMKLWDESIQTAGGLRDVYMNNPPPQANVAAPSDIMGKYWSGAQNQQPFDTSYYQQPMREVYGEMSGARIDPTGINYKQDYNFAPGSLDFNNPYAAGVPKVGPGGGLGATAADYQVPWERVAAQQIAAERINAPGAIDRISGLERVSAPQLQQYQMGPYERVNAPDVRDFQMGQAHEVTGPQLQNYYMQAAQNIAPGGQATTKSWTDPGVAEQYMNPYTQQVVDAQKKRAVEDWQMQNQMLGAEAAKAGAFGGSRHAVREATATRDAMDQMAMLQATGLQQAYQQGMGQFTGEQQMGLAAQQFNLGQGMQAAMANQAAQQQAAQANLQSQLQTQGLGAQLGQQAQLANQAAGLQVGQTNLGALMQAEALRAQMGMQSGLANQAAGLQVGQTNLGALLQTQGLGAQLNMQGQLANQGQTFQQQIANQAASRFEREQQMQASMANQQYAYEAQKANQAAMLQAGLANQQSGLQSGLAAAQMGQAGAMFNAQQGMQGSLANQAAMMQAMGDQYKGGLQGALQTQQLGMQGAITGAQMGQQAAFQQDIAKQNAMNFNLNALGQQGQMAQNMANFGLQGYGANLQGQEALARAADSQQNYQQRQQDVQYANEMSRYQLPFQMQDWYTGMLARAPMSYTQSGTSSSQGTQQAPQASWMSQILGGALGAAGMFIPGRKAKGGVIDMSRGPDGRFRAGGLADVEELAANRRKPKRPAPPPEPHNLDALRELAERKRQIRVRQGGPVRFADGGDLDLGQGEEEPGLWQRLKNRYQGLYAAANQRQPQPSVLGTVAQEMLFPSKRGVSTTGGFEGFSDALAAVPIVGGGVRGTRALGRALKAGQKLEPALQKLEPIAQRAKSIMGAVAESPPARALANEWKTAQTRVSSGLARDLLEKEKTVARVLRPESGLATVQRKPLLVPEAKAPAAPQLLDPAGRPARTPSPQVLEAREARRAQLGSARQNLLPIEEEKIINRPESLQAFQTLTRELPNAHRMESMALLGSPKRNWYKGSSRAIFDVFQSDQPGREKDPVRFAQTLAAMSPQTSVENNLINTLNLWKNWTAAGRPTDPKQIKAIMGQSVMGDKGEESVLHAWFPNVVRALGAADPDRVTLSGPKVDSFFRNLLTEVKQEYANRVTNDAWVANMMGVPQDWFSGKPTELQLMRGDPGFGPGYAAASASQRGAARNLGWKPMEVQETGWSAGKFLYEKADELSAKLGRRVTPMDVLQGGHVTPEALRGTPDFARLLPQGVNRQILEQAGYGEQLGRMRPALPESPALPMSINQQREAERVAETLGRLQQERGLGEQFTRGVGGGSGLGDLIGTEMAEGVPGAGIGHNPAMPTAKWKEKVKYTRGVLSPFENVQGRDVIWDALGVENAPKLKNIGAWRPKARPPEVNPQHTIPVRVPMMGGPGGEVYPSWMDKANAGLAVRGLLTGQKGQAMNILRESANQDAGGIAAQMALDRGKNAPEFTGKTMKKVMKAYPRMDFGHTGPQLNVFDFASQAGLDKTELDQIQKLVSAKKWVRADSLGPYVDFTDEWAKQPGSGEATGKMFSFVQKLDPKDFASLDQAVRGPAGKLYDFYSKSRGAKRKDLMNLLQIIRDQGLTGAEKAWKSGAFLPGLVGAMIAPSMLSQSGEESLQ